MRVRIVVVSVVLTKSADTLSIRFSFDSCTNFTTSGLGNPVTLHNSNLIICPTHRLEVPLRQSLSTIVVAVAFAQGAQALDAPQVTITATCDGDTTHVQLIWEPLDGASYYRVLGRTMWSGEDSLFAVTSATACAFALSTGWSWQSQPDVFGFFTVVVDEPHDMVLVPAGQFMMGQTGTRGIPEHHVSLTHAFLLSPTEVTNGQYLEALNWAHTQGLVSIVGDCVQQYGVDLLVISDSYAECVSHEICYNVDTQQFELQAGTCGDGNSGPGYAYPGGSYDPANHPVKHVTWYGAACYCDWRSQMENLPRYYEGQWSQIPSPRNPYMATGYRLPTEAEWEFAARYSDERLYPWGATLPTCTLANFAEPNWDYCVGWTSPVGTHPAGASALGLQDMAGNQYEWCNDWYASYSADAVSDPPGPASGSGRIVKGGSWGSGAAYLPCADRFTWYPFQPFAHYGFRFSRTLP